MAGDSQGTAEISRREELSACLSPPKRRMHQASKTPSPLQCSRVNDRPFRLHLEASSRVSKVTQQVNRKSKDKNRTEPKRSARMGALLFERTWGRIHRTDGESRNVVRELGKTEGSPDSAEGLCPGRKKKKWPPKREGLRAGSFGRHVIGRSPTNKPAWKRVPNQAEKMPSFLTSTSKERWGKRRCGGKPTSLMSK